MIQNVPFAVKKFDLNIEEVLEDWEIHHAIREIIANALDEQVLTDTGEIEITEDGNTFIIRDYGRGLKYEHLTQNENEEKISNAERVIGKFGVGLKDAMATFDRHKVGICIKSKHGDIVIDKSSKYGFDDVITLHAVITPPSEPDMVGTKVILSGCTREDIRKAKDLFLKFSNDEVLDRTQYGEILKNDGNSNIYINGILVAVEDNFLFSYNITSLTGSMRKALNRERTHVGRTAYADRVKAILLASDNERVARMLSEDLGGYESGTQHDEMKYTDVAVHACKIINATSSVVFATSRELQNDTMGIDNARSDGLTIISIPETLSAKINNEKDHSGGMMRDMSQYNKEWNKSFEFKFVDPDELTSDELQIYNKTPRILDLVGGQPPNVQEILISETMRREDSGFDAGGVWEGGKKRIIIKRDELRDIESYAGTLLHEVAHATSMAGDITRDFELELTSMIGRLCAKSS